MPMEYPELINMLRDKQVVNYGRKANPKPVAGGPGFVGAIPFPDRVLDLLHAPDAERRQQGPVVRQEPGAAADGTSEEGHI